MVKKSPLMVSLFIIAFVLVGGFVLSNAHLDRRIEFKAEWEYVQTREIFQTNAMGQVVQPIKNPARLGNFVDPRGIPSDTLKWLFSAQVQTQVRRQFFCDYASGDVAWSNIVVNAFSSASYTMTNEPIPIVRLMVRSESGEIALMVLSALANKLKQQVEEEQQRRIELVLRHLDMKIKQAQHHGEACAPLEEMREKTRRGVINYQIYTLTEPHLVK